MKNRSAFFIVAIALFTFVLLPQIANGKAKGATNGDPSSYEIMKYSRRVSGHKWRYVLVDKKATKRDIQKIYDDLRAKYPNDYFELFNDVDTLTNMYKHSIKKAKFPDTKGHLGMINQMGMNQQWKFTTMSGYSLLKD